MRIVLDASAAVTAVMDDESHVFAIIEYARVFAPHHYVAEVTSGIWKYVMLRGFPINEAAGKLQRALRLVDKYRNVERLAEEALREASARRHSVYDLYYAVLARREGAAILTFDKRLKQLCTSMQIPLAVA